jgi:hypothetical protein
VADGGGGFAVGTTGGGGLTTGTTGGGGLATGTTGGGGLASATTGGGGLAFGGGDAGVGVAVVHRELVGSTAQFTMRPSSWTLSCTPTAFQKCCLQKSCTASQKSRLQLA